MRYVVMSTATTNRAWLALLSFVFIDICCFEDIHPGQVCFLATKPYEEVSWKLRDPGDELKLHTLTLFWVDG